MKKILQVKKRLMEHSVSLPPVIEDSLIVPTPSVIEDSLI